MFSRYRSLGCFANASQQCVFSFLHAVMACLLLIVNLKTKNFKINFVFTNTTRRKISEINCFKTVFNCIKHSKNVVFLCQAIPGGFRKSRKMVFYTGQTKPRKSQKEHILVSRKSLILGFAKHSTNLSLKCCDFSLKGCYF